MQKEDLDNWDDFLTHFLQSRSNKELDTFLNIFLTITEKGELLNRYRIIKELLKDNKTQREISRTLKVSIANITRASNLLKVTDKEMLKKILKLEN